MDGRRSLRSAAWWGAAAVGVAAAGYATYVALTWLRYGRASPAKGEERDEQLDRFIPRFDVVERHHVIVNAAPTVTLRIARMMELSSLPVVRAIQAGYSNRGDAIFGQLNVAGTGFVILPYFGDVGPDYFSALARDSEGTLYFTGGSAPGEPPGGVNGVRGHLKWTLRASKVSLRGSVLFK